MPAKGEILIRVAAVDVNPGERKSELKGKECGSAENKMCPGECRRVWGGGGGTREERGQGKVPR